ncbi:MAG: hypothetical protein JNK84_02395 [Phreatobacter sp.]|uniref:hypothetical protein n=1 Tax=Phreatobacter sp. TaxID=1966341 RepID=UPI001A43A2FB|nr:hypothetical protein [Phreatobacter sp.]MBL8567912.1 hypothetical protein [Phreatobacter sp.]
MDDAMRKLTRITAYPQGQSTYDCECCGRLSRTIWGEVHDVAGDAVVYYCQWTVEGPEHDANVDLILGPWGDGTTPDDRALISMAFRRSEGSFMVIDVASRHAKVAGACRKGLARDDVIGTCLAQAAFTTVDVIWHDDWRIADLLAAR